jgi:hypothetical protein
VTPRDIAIAWQTAAHEVGELLIWTVCHNTKDYPDLFTARPHLARSGRPGDFVMTDATLEGIRALLPPGLVNLHREPQDDPVIVESWV